MNYLKCEYQRFWRNDAYGTSEIKTGLYLKPCENKEYNVNHYVITKRGEVISVERVIINKDQIKRILGQE